MDLFATLYEDIHEYYGDYIWQQLSTAISYFNLRLPGHAHHATYDAKATALILQEMARLADRELPTNWLLPVMVPCAGGCTRQNECAETDAVWYCADCGVRAGLYHHCPRCQYAVIENAHQGELCATCQHLQERDDHLAAGYWHLCPRCRFSLVKASLAEQELCDNCSCTLAWLQAEEERRRAWEEQSARERKERNMAAARRATPGAGGSTEASGGWHSYHCGDSCRS